MGVTLSGIGLTCAYGSKTYPHKRPYIFEVDEIPTVRKFVVNVGVSTLAHTVLKQLYRNIMVLKIAPAKQVQ